MSVETRRNTFAIANGTGGSWGTCPAFGANTQMFPQSISGLDGAEHEDMPDKGAGFGIVTTAATGPDKPQALTFDLQVYENDWPTFYLLVAMYGNDTPAGAGDPYTHTCIFQEVADYFYGVAGESGTENLAIPSAMTESLEMTFEGNANVCTFKINAKGNTVSVAAGNIFVSCTSATYASPFLMQNTALWINAQAAGALSSSDAIAVTDLSRMWSRPSDTIYPTGSSYIIQPKQGEYPELTLKFKIPHKSADSVTLYTAYRAKTLQKLQLTLTGTSANDVLTFYEPQARITKCTHPSESVIHTEVEMRLEKASSAPTGMSGAVPYCTWKTAIAASPIA